MTSAPRVLVSGVVLGQPMGGVRRHNHELLPRCAELLRAGGGDLAILAGRAALPSELTQSIETLTSSVPDGPPWRRWMFEARAIERALGSARAEGRPFDLVHVAHLPAPRTSLPFTLTLHDLRDLAGRTGPARRLVAPRVITSAVRRARLVVTVSESVRAELEARFYPRDVEVVPNAADHLDVLPRAPRSDAPLLHVGHVEPRKNLELLLRALALDPALPSLELAGASKRGEAARLARLARELGLEERVRFLGSVADSRLPELYAGAAAVVIPSRLEGFGIGVLEAQRASVPLAISNLAALREVAGDDVPTFSPDAPGEAAAAIRAALATSPSVLAERRSAAERFTWQASAESLCRAWRRAAGDSPTASAR